MREMSVRETNQKFSEVIVAAEPGETIVIIRNSAPVAKIAPQSADSAQDADWRAARDALVKSRAGKPEAGFRLCEVTEHDEYGDDQ